MFCTWQYFPSGTLRAGIARYLCERLIGHQDSGDKGYCGGDFEDRWCRWCNKMWQVPRGQFARAADWKFGKIGVKIEAENESKNA